MASAAAADVDAEFVRARDSIPRFSAPSTEVVMPEECQSIPITQPSAWNQNGSLRRESNADGP